MAKTRTTRYDVTEHLRTEEALGDIARARGMAQIARAFRTD